MRLGLSITIGVALHACVATVMVAQAARQDDAGLTVYAATSYGGPHATLRDDTPDLRAIGANDQVSSLRMLGTDRWEICEERNYGGRCAILSSSEPDLARRGWSNRVSSARRIHGAVVSTPGYSFSGIELFTEPSFHGRSTRITGAQSTLGDSAALVRSLRVRAGTWEVCELAGFRGRCALVAGDVPDLRSTGLADHVGSLRLHVNLRRAT